MASRRGGARVGAGRKPKPIDERHAYPVQVNLTRAEVETLLEAAEGEALPAFVRKLVLRHLARRRAAGRGRRPR